MMIYHGPKTCLFYGTGWSYPDVSEYTVYNICIYFFDIYTTLVNQVFQENTSTFMIFHGGFSNYVRFPQNTNFNNSPNVSRMDQ